MRRYTVEPHFADVVLYLEATSLQELFTVAVEGLAYLFATNACQIYQKENLYTLSHPIHLESDNLNSLLVDFLSSILSISIIDKVVYCQTKIVGLDANHVDAIIYGYHYEGIKQEIKEVSLPEVNIIKNSRGNYETSVVMNA